MEKELNAKLRSASCNKNEYRLTWNGIPFSLKLDNSGWLVPVVSVKGKKGRLPELALPYIQAIYSLRFQPQRADVRLMFEKIRQRYPKASKNVLVSISSRVCLLKNDWHCLSELQQAGLTPEQAAEVYFGMAIHPADGSWQAQKYFFELATLNNPQDAEIKFFAQVFSLFVAEAVLNHYEEQLKKVGFYRPLGMIHMEREGPSAMTFPS